MLIIKQGTTRCVLLTKRYAIKLPITFYKSDIPYRGFWYRLLYGLLGNITEKEFSGHLIGDIECAEVIFYIPGGFLNVMHKGEDLTEEEFKNYLNTIDNKNTIVENKICSFKKYGNKIKAVDFGR